MNTESGQLICITTGSKKKKRTIVQLECLNTKKTKTVKIDIKDNWLSLALEQSKKQSLQNLNNVSVEFKRNDNNDPHQIWEQGKKWDRQEIKTETIPQRNRPQDQPQQVQGDRFHNPYNFVPALPREGVEGELGDRKPKGHGCYHKDYWSGRISVKLTTVTPLLIPDAAEMTEDNGHKTYPVRLDADGKPYLPPTSIKGMLRSAYEAVTNSRLSVLEEHNELLAYRMPVKLGLQMVPARIESGQIQLYPGTSTISNNGKPERGDPMYAAWLRRWNRGSTGLHPHRITYAGTTTLPAHGEQVKFWAEEFSKGKFSYWNVRKVVPHSRTLGPTPTPSTGHGQHQPTGKPMRQFEGYVYVTEKNIKNKHDERIFFATSFPDSIPLSPEIKNRWAKLIESYQENDDFKNGLPCPSALDTTANWSRHFRLPNHEKLLEDGTLCYAHVYKNGSSFEVIDLYPVMISRSLYDETPASILDNSLKPTTNYNKLSPADRIFGWVNQKGKGSYKGQLRVHSMNCPRDDAVDDFGGENVNFPLAILGQPKPEQARFYCADDKDGKPIPKSQAKAEGYKYEDQSLRGRKVYPHHKGLAGNYWNNPLEDRTQQPDDTNRYQEYRRPQQKRDSQNRSIKSWVKPETTFEFDIDIINLSSVELGALLWILLSPDVHYHRLGGAKSLGFGSVWLDVDWDKTDLRLGSDWKKFYQSLLPEPARISKGVSCIDDFKKVVVSAYGKGKRFEQVRFISAFCNSSKGFDDAAIHYPRVTPNPTPEGKAFEWFVKNEQDSRESGQKLSLPDLASSRPQTLPLSPIQPQQNNQQRRR